MQTEMTAPFADAVFVEPKRVWIVKTDLRSFSKVPRDAADTSPFAHWLVAGRLFVTPDKTSPTKYEFLKGIEAGEPVFAYEDRVGIVALGRVRYPEDMRTAREEVDAHLYPNAGEMVLSIAVDWDTSVRRSYQQVAQAGHVMAGRAVNSYQRPTRLRSYLLEILREAHQRRADEVDAREVAALERLQRNSAIDARTRAQLIQARVGQGQFRKDVISREPACRLTGVTQAACLVASHIKPWAVCDDGEHLDNANGLMLAPHADHLFDSGLISFEDNGDLLLSPSLNPQILSAWHIDVGTNVGPFAQDQARYLAFHRRHVLGQPRPRWQRNLVGDVPASVLVFDTQPQLASDLERQR